MAIASELATLFHRDLTRLIQQVSAFPSDSVLWSRAPGITNSAGNLALHLEGNLRDFVGRGMGGIPYERARDQEFASRYMPAAEIASRLEHVRSTVPDVIGKLTEAQLRANFPNNPLGGEISTQQFLIHLLGHLTYHLGQIDYLRRILTAGLPVQYAQL